jgi:mono/diheme cytochrome c family protein
MNRISKFARPTGWVAAFILALLAIPNAQAQQVGDADAGKRLVDAACAGCHSPSVRPKRAPDFAAIAAMPSTTALSLGVFMRTSHPTMPNVVLTPAELDDVIGFILSLRR